MDNRKMITIMDESGNKEQVEALIAFRMDVTNKDYVIYTKNEQDEDGNVTIYASAIEEQNGQKVLTGIATDDEWEKIKEILKELAKDE
ncbi:MAG: DUF1292 domain-containing protein [Bacilli bacterium]|jgi:uncharacterized protein YrzB (UPF0473 family)|nr:DUF1292 domain-containing protein [Bacilli bacterium]